MNTQDINYTKEAFLNTWNLVFLAAASGVTAGIGIMGLFPNWVLSLAMVLIVGVELLYLGMMPRNDRFQRHVRSQKMAEKHKPPSQREIFDQLHNESQKRLTKLRRLRDEVEVNYRKLSSASQGLLDSHLQKIDGLIESYLELLYRRERYRDMTRRNRETEIQKTMRSVKNDMADDTNRVKAVKKRRLKVLERRLARFQKARENLEIIGAQLVTIEDVVSYIHEQSMTLQDPQEVSYQLDALLQEVEETQASIRQIEDVFATPSDFLDDEVDDELAALDEEFEREIGEGASLDVPDVDVSDLDASTDDAGSSKRRVRE